LGDGMRGAWRAGRSRRPAHEPGPSAAAHLGGRQRRARGSTVSGADAGSSCSNHAPSRARA